MVGSSGGARVAVELSRRHPDLLAEDHAHRGLEAVERRLQPVGARRERRDALLESLQALMPEGTTWTIPAGGFYSWVTLPQGLDATAMLPRAVGLATAAALHFLGSFANDCTGIHPFFSHQIIGNHDRNRWFS